MTQVTKGVALSHSSLYRDMVAAHVQSVQITSSGRRLSNSLLNGAMSKPANPFPSIPVGGETISQVIAQAIEQPTIGYQHRKILCTWWGASSGIA